MYLEIGISSDEFQQTCSRQDATKTRLNGDLMWVLWKWLQFPKKHWQEFEGYTSLLKGKRQQSQILIAIYFKSHSRWCSWREPPQGWGAAASRARQAGSCCSAAVGAKGRYQCGFGERTAGQPNPRTPPQPWRLPRLDGTWQGSYPRSPACKLWLRFTDVGTGTGRPAGPALHAGALRAHQHALYPPLLLPGVCLRVCSGTRRQCSPGCDCRKSSSAVGKGLVEKLRGLGSGAVLGLRPLLLAFAGIYARGGSTWPCAMLTLADRLPCPTLELSPDHERVWWLTPVTLTSLTVWILLFQVSVLLCQQENV